MPTNEFERYARERDARGGQSAALRLQRTTLTPDQAGEAERLAAELGVPAAAVRLDIDRFRRDAERKRAGAALAPAPATAAWLQQPGNAEIAADDVENLTAWEKFVRAGQWGADKTAAGRAVERGARTAYAGTGLGRVELADQLEADIGRTLDELTADEIRRAEDQQRETMGVENPELTPMIRQLAVAQAQRRFNAVADLGEDAAGAVQELRQEGVERLADVENARRELPGSPGAAAFQQTLATQKKRSGGNFFDIFAALGRDPLGGLAFLGETMLEGAPQIGAAAAIGAATRNPVAAAATLGGGTFSQEAVSTVTQELQKAGVDVGDPDALMAALDDDKLMQAALGKGYTRGAIIGVVEALSGRLTAAGLASGSKAKAGLAVASDVALAAGGEIVAGAATGGVDWTAVGVEAVAEGLMSGPLEGLAVAAGEYGRAQDAKQAAARQTAVLDELDTMAAASKVKQRAPGKFKEALDAQGLGDQALHVPADDVRDLFQSEAGEVDDATLAGLGVTRDQYEAALVSGSDLPIPLSNYATNFAGTPQGAQLKERGTLDPDGIPSAAEAARGAEIEAMFTEAVEEARSAAATAGEAASVDVQVRDEIATQLTAAGRAPQAAAQEALVWSSFFRSMSDRYGTPVEELTQRFGVSIRRAGVMQELPTRTPAEDTIAEAPGVELDQSAPAFKEWFGDSKVVDRTGAPLTVYHGTKSTFDAFFPLSHFGTAKAADDRVLGRRSDYDDGTYVVPVKLSIQSPLDVGIESDADGNSWNTVADMLHQVSGKLDLIGQSASAEVVREVAYELDEREAEVASEDIRELMDEAREAIEMAGFDGLTYKNAVEDAGQRSYVALRPEQVKSVFNRGTFDFDDDRFLYQRAADRRAPADVGERTGAPMPSSLAKVYAMAKERTFSNGRDFKLAVQDMAPDGLDELTPEAAARLEDYVVEDALEALQDNGNAVGWYDSTVTRAKATLAEMYPEIAAEGEAEFAFIWALAVTSNGLKVNDNFKLAASVYEFWRKNGRFPDKAGTGTAAKQIDAGLAQYSTLLEQTGSWEAARDFMVGQHEARDIARQTGIKPTGEAMGEVLRGASILGPKIGNGFFSNLYGHFDALTMDRWLMRTVGRWRGTLVKVNDEAVAAKRLEMRTLFKALSKRDLDALSAYVGAPIRKKMTDAEIDALGSAIQQETKDPSFRQVMNALPGGDALRRLGNRLATVRDGQQEAPSGAKERTFLRGVFRGALERLQQDHGLNDMTMADLQALLWYPEKLLYDTAKMPEGQEIASYADDDAPDYANAARNLVAERGRAAERSAGGPRPDAAAAQPGPAAGVGRGGSTRYTSGSMAPLPGAPQVAGASGPDPRLVEVAEKYAADNGIRLRRQSEFAEVDPERAARIAEAYEQMEHAPNDPRVRAAYQSLADQTRAQYDALVEAGYEFWLFDSETDPYEGKPWNAMRDLRANQKMAVYATEAGFGSDEAFDPTGNPLMEDTGLRWPYGAPDGELRPVYFNDLFRAVHDAFGHGIEGAGFRARGEENAWQAHVRLFHGDAVAALTSETRGQNSWLNYGPHGEANRTASVEDTVFADQKTGLMPEWTWTEGRAGNEPFSAPNPYAFRKLKQQQPYATLDQLMSRSPYWHGLLNDTAARVAEGLGLEAVRAPMKTRESAERKVAKYGGDYRQMTDVVRTGVTVTSIEKADRFVAQLALEFDVYDEGWVVTEQGYFDRKLIVRFETGQLAEVQMWPPGMFDAEELQGGHAMYETWRDPASTAEQVAEADRGMQRLYADVASTLDPSFAAALGIETPYTEAASSGGSSTARSSDRTMAAVAGENGDQLSSDRSTDPVDRSSESAASEPASKVNVRMGDTSASDVATSVPDVNSYFGIPLNADGTLTLTHWSDRRRQTIDPAFAGTGPLNGRERKGGQGVAGTYWGLNVGQEGGYRKENLGVERHEVAVDPSRLYPFLEDPDGLRDAELWANAPARAVPPYEKAIRDAGYDGYVVTHTVGLGQTAKLFVPVEPDSVTTEQRSYAQGEEGGERGRIRLPAGGVADAQTVIELFDGADLSTVLHESAHFFLEVFTTLASDASAPADMQADLATIRKHLGNEGETWTTEQHELWARSFEGYAMEGKAPSLELQDAFARFKGWLTHIYRTIRGIGEVRLNAEVRAVMDRMVATEDQIAAAQAELGRNPLFAERPKGMSESDWKTYQRLARRATDDAERRLLKRTMARVRAERTAEYREQLKAAREAAADEVNARPVYRLLEALTNGRWLGRDEPLDDLRIDRQDFVDMFDQETADQLGRAAVGGRRSMFSEEGLEPAEVARMFGFESATTMVDAIRAAPRRQVAIDEAAQEAMDQTFGKLDDPAAVEEAVQAALHAEASVNTTVAEARHLAGMAGRSTAGITQKAYRLRVRRMLGDMDVKTATQSARYRRAERRAARKAQEAFAKVARQGSGSTQAIAEAFQAKEQQLLAQVLYDESRKIAAMVESGRARMKTYERKGTRKKLEGGYIEQIDQLLERYDFRRRTPGQIQKAESLKGFIERMVAAGRERELNIDDRLLRDASSRHYSTLSVDQLRGVFDTVANIDHLGRLKQKLIEAQRTRDLNASAKVVADAVRKSQKPQDRTKGTGLGRRVLNTLRRVDTIMVSFDSGAEMGGAYDQLKRTIDEGQNLEQDMQRKMAEGMTALFEAHYGKDARALQKRRAIPGITRREWTKEEILAVALNTGNKDNFQRLTADDVDPEYRIDERTLDTLLNQLDQNDWDFVQGMWDFVDSYWPQLSEVHRRRTGVPPKKIDAQLMVEPRPGVTGGYYPIKYDPRLGHKEAMDEDQKLWDIANGWGATVQVANGMTIQRKQSGGGRTLKLDLSVPTAHLRDTIRYVAMSEAVDASNRILHHPAVVDAMQATGHEDTRRVLKLWLEDMASGPVRSSDVVSAGSRMVKNNFTLSRLALNLKTVFLQTTGISQSAAVIGKGAMFDGMQAYLRSPREAIAEVTGASALMRERQTTFQKDVYDIIDETAEIGPIQSRYRRTKTQLAKIGFWPMIKTQFLTVDMPTWLGAYRAEVARSDSHDAAVHYADRMVARAQDSGLFADRAAFERGTLSANTRQSDFLRVFTTLGGYMLTKANRLEVLTIQTREGIRQARTPKEKAAVALNAATDLTLLLAFEAVILATVAELAYEDDEDDLSWGAFVLREAVKAPFAAVPFVRDAVSAFSGFGGGGVYGSVAEIPARLYGQIEQGEVDGPLLKAVGDGVGLVTGLPSTAASRALAPLIDGDDVTPAEMLFGRNPLAQ